MDTEMLGAIRQLLKEEVRPIKEDTEEQARNRTIKAKVTLKCDCERPHPKPQSSWSHIFF